MITDVSKDRSVLVVRFKQSKKSSQKMKAVWSFETCVTISKMLHGLSTWRLPPTQ